MDDRFLALFERFVKAQEAFIQQIAIRDEALILYWRENVKQNVARSELDKINLVTEQTEAAISIRELRLKNNLLKEINDNKYLTKKDAK